MTKIPDSWWKEACEAITHPIACVNVDNKFVWCNYAWEEMCGYSLSELRDKTWIAITHKDDVGGDLVAATDMLEGRITKYITSKRYIHKTDRVIPIELGVFRYPPTGHLELYIVQAIELKEETVVNAIKEMELTIAALNEKIYVMERNAIRKDHLLNWVKTWWFIIAGIIAFIGWVINFVSHHVGH